MRILVPMKIQEKWGGQLGWKSLQLGLENYEERTNQASGKSATGKLAMNHRPSPKTEIPEGEF